jgi:hypothetical protein
MGGEGGRGDLAGRAVRVISMRHHSCFRRHVLEGLAEVWGSVFRFELCRINFRDRVQKKQLYAGIKLQHG